MRTSVKKDEWARKKAYLAQTKPTEVVVTKVDPKSLKFDKKGRKGHVGSNYIKRKREIGDKRFIWDEKNQRWIEYVAFKGGEGGNGWTVRSTLI